MKKITHRTLCLLMSVLLVVSTVSVAVVAAADTQTYTSNTIVAVNTDYSTKISDPKWFSYSKQDGNYYDGEEESAEISSELTFEQLNAYLSDLIVPLSPEEALAAEDDIVEAQGLPKKYRVGQTKKFNNFYKNFSDGDYNDSAVFLKNLLKLSLPTTTLTCRYVGSECTVWIEEGCEWTAEYIEELGTMADETIPSLYKLFGDRRIDTDNDGKFALFVHTTPSNSAGYFFALDLIDRNSKIGGVKFESSLLINSLSANTDCIHISSEADNIDDIKSIFVHEFQHYINSSHSYAEKTNETYLAQTETYLNEGFSVASQFIFSMSEYYYSTLIYKLNSYDIYETSLTAWGNIEENYALSFAFAQYFRTRYAALTNDTSTDFPGKGIYKLVMESRNRSNQLNTLGVIADILYPPEAFPELQDTDARCKQLIVDFWLALLLKEPTGIHGFNGEEWANDINICLNANEYIYSGMASFVTSGDDSDSLTNTITIDSSDDGIVFVPLELPTHKITLDYNDESIPSKTLYSLDNYLYLDYSYNQHRDGYICTGFYSSSDSYSFESMVPVEEDITLYAEWIAAEKLEIDTVYNLTTPGEAFYAEITPTEDGIYTFECNEYFYADFYDGEQTRSVWSDPEYNYVTLSGGTTYDIIIYYADDELSLSLTQVKDLYSVTYHDSLYNYDDVTVYDNQYVHEIIVPEYYDYSDYWRGVDFLGWATQPNSTAVEYLPSEVILLTEDLELYSVYTPWDSIKADETYTRDYEEGTYYNLIFTPEVAATYQFIAENADEITVRSYYSDTINVSDSDTKYTLVPTQTYSIRTNASSICVRFVSAAIEHSLTLDVGGSDWLDVTLTGKRTYTIPDYRPIPLRAEKFVCWENAETQERYYPGDTISLTKDTVLRSRCIYYSTTENEPTDDLALIILQMKSSLKEYFVIILKSLPAFISSLFSRIFLFGF